MQRCHECGKETNVSVRSVISGQRLCPECSEKEKKRPIYQKNNGVEPEGLPPRHGLPNIAGPGKDGINFYR
jgi:hypothetical protein